MKSVTDHVDSESIAVEAERSLQCLLSSTALQRAPALRRLLIYLWEHRDQNPTEYSVGVDVIGKRPDFDPKLDASVRVHISRLRQKLKEFFDNEGRSMPVHLLIPAGGIHLILQEARVPAGEPAPPVSAPPASPSRSQVFVLAAVTCVGLLSFVAAVHYWNEARSLRARSAQSHAISQLPEFWARALLNGKPSRLVFPTPVFLRSGNLRVRDVRINDSAELSESPELKLLFGPKEKPALVQTYSVAADTLATAMIVKMLTSAGVPVDVSSTRDLSIELQGGGNLVFLGIPHTSPHVDTLLAHTSFYFKPSESLGVYVRDPRPGEPSFIPPSQLTGAPDILGIIARLPGQTPDSHVILLSGNQTSALASYLTSPISLHELNSYLSSQGNPEFFELVLSCKVEGLRLLTAKAIQFRTVAANFWK